MAIWMRNVNIGDEADGLDQHDLDGGYCFWSNWSVRQWPFNHVAEGDGILLVESWESPARGSRISWYGEMQAVLTEAYETVDDLAGMLEAQYELDPDALAADDYLAVAPEPGYVLGFRVWPVRRVGVERPAEVTLRPNGWRRTDDLDPALVEAWTGER